MSKILKPTTAQFDAYQKMFDYFNKHLFSTCELPQPLLNLSRLKNAMGFFAPGRWSNSEGETVHEISLNPEVLAHEPKQVLAVLVHEMCHLWQHALGTPGRKSYHDREWASKMIEVGLQPTDTGLPGGKTTGQRMDHIIVEGGPFDLHFQAMPETYLLPFLHKSEFILEEEKEKKAKNKIKYTCPSCDANAWGKPDLAILCIPCEVPFLGEGQSIILGGEEQEQEGGQDHE
jgi:predicted SprT family Zn-dependent metalloprotease